MNRFKNLPKGTKTILIIQCIAMLMGASTHISWALQNGFLSENYQAPLGTMLFWDSLTFLDLIAAFLLISRPKTGVILTVIIIVSDVIHNNLYYYEELYNQSIGIGEWIKTYWMILGQIAFALFVLVTFSRNLKAINSKNDFIHR